jgi:hypothetical protein
LPAVVASSEHFVETAGPRALTVLSRRRLWHQGNQHSSPEARLCAKSCGNHWRVAYFPQPYDYHLMLEQHLIIVWPLSRYGHAEANVFEYSALWKRIVCSVEQEHRASLRASCHDRILGYCSSQSSCQ